MGKKLLKTNVRPQSVKIILIGLAILIFMNLLARLNIVNLTTYDSNLLTIIGSLFLLSEVAIISIIRKAKKGSFKLVDTVIAVVGISAIIGSVLALVGITLQPLVTIQGIVEIALLICVLVEIFRKN